MDQLVTKSFSRTGFNWFKLMSPCRFYQRYYFSSAGMSEKRIRTLNSFHPRSRVKMDVVVKRLGQSDDSIHQWLVLTPRDQLPKPEKEAWPRPEKRSDGSYIYDRWAASNRKKADKRCVVKRFACSLHTPKNLPFKFKFFSPSNFSYVNFQLLSWL